MAAHGAMPDKTIWVTEVGAPTRGTNEYGTVISEDAQGIMARQIFAFASQPQYTWLGPIFWYDYQDFPVPAEPLPSSECCFGLRRADSSAKPVADVFGTAEFPKHALVMPPAFVPSGAAVHNYRRYETGKSTLTYMPLLLHSKSGCYCYTLERWTAHG